MPELSRDTATKVININNQINDDINQHIKAVTQQLEVLKQEILAEVDKIDKSGGLNIAARIRCENLEARQEYYRMECFTLQALKHNWMPLYDTDPMPTLKQLQESTDYAIKEGISGFMKKDFGRDSFAKNNPDDGYFTYYKNVNFASLRRYEKERNRGDNSGIETPKDFLNRQSRRIKEAMQIIADEQHALNASASSNSKPAETNSNANPPPPDPVPERDLIMEGIARTVKIASEQSNLITARIEKLGCKHRKYQQTRVGRSGSPMYIAEKKELQKAKDALDEFVKEFSNTTGYKAENGRTIKKELDKDTVKKVKDRIAQINSHLRIVSHTIKDIRAGAYQPRSTSADMLQNSIAALDPKDTPRSNRPRR